MARGRYSYLDLTVLPDLRGHVIARHGAVLFSADLTRVLWSNGEGARLLGAPSLRELLEETFSPNHVLMRQIAPSVERLEAHEVASAMLRARTGIKTRLIAFSVRTVELPDGMPGVLLVSDSLRGRSHGDQDMAQVAVDSLDGFNHASVIVNEKGNVVASSSQFEQLDISVEALAKLVNEVADEEDRLVKRAIETNQGPVAAGVARIADSPAMHLLIIASNAAAASEAATTEDEPERQRAGFLSARKPPANTKNQKDKYPEPPEEAEEPRRTVEPSPVRDETGGSGESQRWFYHGSSSSASPVSKVPEDVPKPEPYPEDDADIPLLDALDEKPSAGSDDIPAPQPSTDQPQPVSNDAISASGLVQTIQHTPLSDEDGYEEDDVGDLEEPVELAAEASEGISGQADDDFRFTAGTRPVRFVWSMDQNKVFSTVSGDLASAVGPQSAAIEGLKWREVAETHGFDDDRSIDALLEKGDTWSSKTVLWPVQGTDLRVPIDLAGLPAIGKGQTFEGFNGFGIIRTADAMVDPEERGLHLASAPSSIPEEEPDSEFQPDENFIEDYVGDYRDPVPPSGDDGLKIVDLGERVDIHKRELSEDEQEAFDEIAEKLSNTGDMLSEDVEEVADEPTADSIGDIAEDTRDNPAIEPLDYVTRRKYAVEDIVSRVREEVPPKPPEKPQPPKQLSGYIPSAFAGRGADQGEKPKEIREVDTSILSRLPIPVLVYRDEELLFANEEFFDLTGYETLSDLDDAGGIDALFSNEAPVSQANQSTILHSDGTELDVSAHLQRVPWDEERAMLLTLRRGERDDDYGPESGDDDSPDKDRDPVKPVPSGGYDDTIDQPTAERDKPTLASVTSLDSRRSDGVHPFGGLSDDDLRNILDTATDGVMVLHNDGMIRAINSSAEALFDIDGDAIIGQHFTKLLAGESHRLANDYLAGLAGTGVASVLNDGREVIGRVSGGGLVPLFMTLGRLGGASGCCAVVRDITHWKKAEEELVAARSEAENASNQKTEFLARISHEVRTPLNAIIGFSDIMIEERFGKIGNARYIEYLRDIRLSGEHVLELVNDLLDISKIEAGELDLKFDAVALNAVVTKTVALNQPHANKDRIIIRTSLSSAVPKVVADPRSIRQIILNLVSNAIKYTEAGGQVIVSTVYEEAGEVVVRVRDTGIGMSEGDIETAMKPFRQISTLSKSKGTGLGLPLTKAMVEANRARFHIESEPGNGTLVEIRFPPQRVLAD